MNRTASWGFVALIVGAVTPSCGGDSAEFPAKPNAAGRAGSTNKGGSGGTSTGSGGSSARGGTTSTGGTAPSTGGTATNGGSSDHAGNGTRGGGAGIPDDGASGEPGDRGGPPMGGRAGSAGSAGSTGCPTAAPEKDASCSAAASCYYPGERCDCAGMMDDLKWHCRGSGEACPANAPTSGGACESEMGMPLACPYSDGSECHCEHDEWKCDMPPDPSAGGAPPEPPGPPDPAAGGAPDMPGGGRPGGPDPMDPGGRAG